ncbi:hypothetical protein RO3G_06711 [Rhizopus delemar RA 99-880]|uniref:Glucosidase II beta subunit N-terminal domain-containing protein n=1 Tax=Rhizopus delemar (strain RA 99-880 / ATCC MYA-4621 / FGSC 9543 / NRRL 43880) TaxID=246409 RepID=I1C0M6_RHIO9|nr:hypothetical protein RO3G_06711 [Rhizopus delemar RA 99-880]|eukprot:EIE82006.1 hypothetical protein RO3G_06711 [Rhizopus delemar RA 99-880]
MQNISGLKELRERLWNWDLAACLNMSHIACNLRLNDEISERFQHAGVATPFITDCRFRVIVYQSLSNGKWWCLDSSKVISYTTINGDCCDCSDNPDGSAGTFACANSYFYCENKYYIPAYIKFYSVNDDVCDEVYCKDSNESNGHIGCPNRCKDLGETYRMEKNFKKKEINPGLRIKYKLIQEVESQVATWEEEKTELEDELILRKSEMLKLEYELNALKVKNQEDMAKTNCPSCIQELTSLKLDISVLKYE